ncbi:hypothetical protein D9756_001195 [Leucocoprinus leucothites]|uniref:Uncharacterized protein n=1 Tax=Leucocoprinus leucothites TaxID=201217 RepID=A0A8H5LIK7_9AGAR|nr:hypothetical protein D9756_001195 [Leucoagaricus leucothites]
MIVRTHHLRHTYFRILPPLSRNIDPYGAGDTLEGFQLGREAIDKANEARSEDGAMVGANVWPSDEDVPGFRDAVLRYYHAAVMLGKSLFPIFALALDLPETFFDDKLRHSAALMKLLHYPPQTGPVDDRTVGIGAIPTGSASQSFGKNPESKPYRF